MFHDCAVHCVSPLMFCPVCWICIVQNIWLLVMRWMTLTYCSSLFLPSFIKNHQELCNLCRDFLFRPVSAMYGFPYVFIRRLSHFSRDGRKAVWFIFAIKVKPNMKRNRTKWKQLFLLVIILVCENCLSYIACQVTVTLGAIWYSFCFLSTEWLVSVHVDYYFIFIYFFSRIFRFSPKNQNRIWCVFVFR